MNRRVFICSFLVALLLATLMAGCGPAKEETLTGPVKIASLNGPTGIGMVKLMEEPDKYQVTAYQSPDEVVGKIITGEVDIAALPSNLGAVLYNKLEGDVVLLGINTLGILYIVENGETIKNMADLKGKTIVASGKGGSPEFILNQLIKKAGMDPAKDLEVNWLLNHSDVASTLMANEGTIAMLPQPFTTIVTEKNPKVGVRVDLNQEWEQSEGVSLPMGILIGKKSFVTDRAADLDIFLKAYAASVEFVNTQTEAAAGLVSKYGIIPDEAIARKAIPACNIVFISAEDGQEDLNAFYEIISEMDPKSIGGNLPDEEFYYRQTQ